MLTHLFVCPEPTCSVGWPQSGKESMTTCLPNHCDIARRATEIKRQDHKWRTSMNAGFFLLLLPLILPGCSKNPPAPSPRPSASAAPNVATSRPKIAFVQSPETKEQNLIKQEALTRLANKDYAALEALAAKHRVSKERYASGKWKLGILYSGFEPSGNASDAEWQARLNQIQDWMKARPEAITPRVASARIMTSYAWRARGSATADQVKDASWQTFFARLQKALTSLEESKRLKEK